MMVVVVGSMLAVCCALLVWMRDPVHADPHPVAYSVRCPRYRRTVVVEFIERTDTGLTMRRVSQCPLRRPGERCQGCLWQCSSS